MHDRSRCSFHARPARGGRQRRYLALDEVNHLFRIGRPIDRDLPANFYQVVDRLFFPADDVHAAPLRLLDRGADLAHGFIMQNRWTGIVDRFLDLGFQPLRIGSGFVRVFHGGGPIWTLVRGGAVRVVVHRVHVEARNANPFQVIDQRLYSNYLSRLNSNVVAPAK